MSPPPSNMLKPHAKVPIDRWAMTLWNNILAKADKPGYFFRKQLENCEILDYESHSSSFVHFDLRVNKP
ncbi:hypothetical protein GX51_05693 [Blastomyces parvus]|uniref:Uncharacterized protein n=1 Tax=Blastomyces parvus TaxID=2060905 RepID=A0A2B7WMK4_9EURO|nr:hypothetical protein GX51_05693 [Blastomyces parvus]